MQRSTTDHGETHLFVPLQGTVDRLPWPFAAMTIAGLAGGMWGLIALVCTRLI